MNKTYVYRVDGFIFGIGEELKDTPLLKLNEKINLQMTNMHGSFRVIDMIKMLEREFKDSAFCNSGSFAEQEKLFYKIKTFNSWMNMSSIPRNFEDEMWILHDNTAKKMSWDFTMGLLVPEDGSDMVHPEDCDGWAYIRVHEFPPPDID